jgi:hypothetical protein
MLSVKNNFYLTENYHQINLQIFEYEILRLDTDFHNVQIVYRRKKNSSKLKFLLSKSGLITEFRGFFEIWGRFTYSLDQLTNFLIKLNSLIKIYNPGIIIFKNFHVDKIEDLNLIKEIFLKNGFEYRDWKTKIIDVDLYYEKNMDQKYHKKIKKDILAISAMEPSIIEVRNENEFNIYLELFFTSFGHANYPEQENLKKKISWELYKKNHKLFMLKKNNDYLGVFGIRIFDNLSSLIMIGRNKILNNSIHSFAIDFLINFLKKKNIQYFDLTGFNPKPNNSKELGIKFFKERFQGSIVEIPSFVKDNTYLLKFFRKFLNIIYKNNKLSDENWLIY